MTDNHFEDFLRDKLYHHSSPVPGDMWNRIAQEQRRKPAGWWWNKKVLLTAAAWLIVAITAGVLLFTHRTTQEAQIPAKSTVTANSTTIQSGSTTNNNSTTNKAIENKMASTIPSSGNAATGAAINTITNTTAQIPTTPIINEQHHSTNDVSFNNTIASRTSAVPKRNNRQRVSGFATGLMSVNTETVAGDNTIAANHFMQGSLIGINSFAALSMPAVQPPIRLPKFQECPSINGYARDDWYLELYASPDYTMKSVHGTTANNAYLRKKDSVESMHGGFTIGGRLVKNFGQHFLLKAGLQYSQVNEQLQLKTENERRLIMVVTTKTITDANGNVTTVSDTTTVMQIGYSVKKSYNYYRNIELPVLVGYEFGNDDWKFSINGGMIFNLSTWYRGNVLDSTSQMVAINAKGNNPTYHKKAGMSLYGSMSIIKPVSETLDVFAEPYFRYGLTNIEAKDLGFTQRFNAAGLTLGVRYKINNRRQHL